MTSQGHRAVPHTADLTVEAWAPTREACLAEAVRGLVDSFAVAGAAQPQRTVRRRLPAGPAEDLLVAALDEVIYWLDTEGEVPVSVTVQPAGGSGTELTLSLASIGAMEITSAAPKAASWHGLWFGPDEAGQWSCRVTVDV